MFTPRSYPVLPREHTLAQLPPESTTNAQDQISHILSTTPLNRLVILDDDPTGTQTCHSIPVLTTWDTAALVAEFQRTPPPPGFFILTNSRAHPPLSATPLIQTICENVAQAAAATNQTVNIVLRSDSTLRGHFPLEIDVAESVFGAGDAWVLAPFFLQGGRFTIDDVHYVLEGEQLVPAGKTQFAQDATFGYRSSSLRDFVLEKAPGRGRAERIVSVSIEDLRIGGPGAVYEKLMSVPRGGVVIVNAVAESDMGVFVAGSLMGGFFPHHHYYVVVALPLYIATRGLSVAVSADADMYMLQPKQQENTTFTEQAQHSSLPVSASALYPRKQQQIWACRARDKPADSSSRARMFPRRRHSFRC